MVPVRLFEQGGTWTLAPPSPPPSLAPSAMVSVFWNQEEGSEWWGGGSRTVPVDGRKPVGMLQTQPGCDSVSVGMKAVAVRMEEWAEFWNDF